MAEKRLVGRGDKSAFRAGCDEAKRRLDPIDDRRRTDPEYRAGFSSEVSIAPLESTTALPPGAIVPPPNTRPNAAPGLQTHPCPFDPAQKARVVFKAVVEPVILPDSRLSVIGQSCSTRSPRTQPLRPRGIKIIKV